MTCVIIVRVEINVLIDDEFRDYLEIDWLQSIAEQVLTLQEFSSEAELGLVITSQKRVQELNRKYLGRNAPTDVIAFHMRANEAGSPFILPPDGMLHLGEVIISYPQAAVQAKEQGHSVRKEIAILIIHGILHLLGYEDETPELRQGMLARERQIISRIGID